MIYFCIVKNIIKDIEQNCKECCEPDKTIKFLFDRGDISYTSEYYREIWFFYKESLTLFKKSKKQKKEARDHTCEMMGISEPLFWKISKKLRKRFS